MSQTKQSIQALLEQKKHQQPIKNTIHAKS